MSVLWCQTIQRVLEVFLFWIELKWITFCWNFFYSKYLCINFSAFIDSSDVFKCITIQLRGCFTLFLDSGTNVASFISTSYYFIFKIDKHCSFAFLFRTAILLGNYSQVRGFNICILLCSAQKNTQYVLVFDAFVIVICLASLILCTRSIVLALRLRKVSVCLHFLLPPSWPAPQVCPNSGHWS
jgi:hypothetical protein